jgi:hypothetical protein
MRRSRHDQSGQIGGDFASHVVERPARRTEDDDPHHLIALVRQAVNSPAVSLRSLATEPLDAHAAARHAVGRRSRRLACHPLWIIGTSG